MREFQERHKFRKRLYSRTSIVALVVIALFILHGVYKVHVKEKAARARVEQSLKTKAELEKRYEDVAKKTEFLKSQQGIEYEIRSKFDVRKADESVVVILEPQKKEVVPEKKSGIKAWLKAIGD
jgi:cell division protein FtsX